MSRPPKPLPLVCPSCREPIASVREEAHTTGEVSCHAVPCGCSLSGPEFEATKAHILQHREDTEGGA